MKWKSLGAVPAENAVDDPAAQQAEETEQTDAGTERDKESVDEPGTADGQTGRQEETQPEQEAKEEKEADEADKH